MNKRELSRALASRKRVYGTCVTSPNPIWVTRIKKTGIDFVFIDTEHIPLDRSQISFMCQAYEGAGIAPIVRLQSPNPFDACATLDAGAAGIVFPYVETVEEAKSLRGAVKYRPLKGQKLQDVLDGRTELSDVESGFFRKRNEHNMAVLNIESAKALDNLDQLLDVPDIDAVFIGPNDLSINLGCPEDYDNPVFLDAVRFIIDRCRKHHISVGNHFSYGIEKQIEWGKSGMNIFLWNVDVIRFSQALDEDFARIKQQFGDDHTADALQQNI